MGLALFKDRRLADRRRLTGLLPGRLVVVEGARELIARPVDVSRNGLGVVANAELAPGTRLALDLKDRAIMLEVAWVQPDFGKQDMFRFGLVTLSEADDVEDVFVRSGCMR
jgi:hypothetical protein